MSTGVRNSDYVFFKYGFLARLLAVLFITVQISACGFSRPIILDSFMKSFTLTRSDLERDIQKANQSINCLAQSKDTPNVPESLHASAVKHTSMYLIRALQPALVGRRIAEAKDSLSKLNASCKAREGILPADEVLLCDYSFEYVWGMRGLYVFGWHVEWARLQIDKFAFTVISQRGSVSNVIIDNIDGECFEIDKAAFENAEQIVKARRVYW